MRGEAAEQHDRRAVGAAAEHQGEIAVSGEKMLDAHLPPATVIASTLGQARPVGKAWRKLFGEVQTMTSCQPGYRPAMPNRRSSLVSWLRKPSLDIRVQ